MSERDPCINAQNEICQLYCADGRRLCDEVSEFDLLLAGINNIQVARDAALSEANIDKLTGLLNKTAFFEIGERAVNDAGIDGSHFGVIMLDITNFKAYNDTEGHVAGDELLAKVGHSLKSLLRGDDYVTARFGGDEFVILCKLHSRSPELEQAPDEQILAITTRLHSEVGELLANEAGFLLGAFGAKVWSAGETFKDVLVAADAGMYTNKRRQKGLIDQYAE